MNVPEEACAYEKYDPVSLVPVNNETYIRLIELGFQSSEFKGKSVLDIGCNTGMLSIHALNLGAKEVKSVDVQKPLLSFFGEVIAKHNLPIKLYEAQFNNLVPNEDSADIVLMMEVLHWIVDQGSSISNAIEKLAGLCNEILYIETPWDTNEPSIAAKGVIQHEQYNMPLILNELSKYFEEISFERFMTYFGNMKDSKRILIKASKKRIPQAPLSKIPNIGFLDVELQRGINSISLITSGDKLKVLKKIPNHSIFNKLSNQEIENLLSILGGGELIPKPICVGGSYVHKNISGDSFMLFPFVGKLENLFPKNKLNQIDAQENPLYIASLCRNYFREANSELINKISEVSEPLYEKEIPNIIKLIDRDGKWEDITPFLLHLYTFNDSLKEIKFDAIIHGDLQFGNMVEDHNCNVHLVDLDNIRSGTIYSEILIAALYSGSNIEELKSVLASVELLENRSLSKLDVIFSGCYFFGWIEAISKSQVALENSIPQINRALHGFDTLKALYDSIE